MNLLTEPVVYLDRRLPWNRDRRHRWRRVLDALPLANGDRDVHQAAGQAIGLFKLMAIVAAGVSPLILILFFLMQSVFTAKLADSRELLQKEMDGRYVIAAVDAVRMADYGQKIADNTATNHSQETRIIMLENKLQQIQARLDEIRSTQLSQTQKR